jgi:IS5 family transposase
MIGKTVRPASLFAFAFFKEAASINEPVLDSLDDLLEDPKLLALSTQALASRSPRSNQAGREGIAPDRLLRCVVLKHVKGWSYRQLHRELRASLLYRRFTRFYEDPIPDFSNLCRAFALFGKQGTEQIHRRIAQQAQEAAIIAGKKLRTDTTAVETNIHHPTDSSLLADSLRVTVFATYRPGLSGFGASNRQSRPSSQTSSLGDWPGGPDLDPGRARTVKAKL